MTSSRGFFALAWRTASENYQSSMYKRAILIGQIGGFAAGLVLALLLSTDSRVTAISGMVLGTAAGFLTQTQYSLWTRVGVALVTLLSVTYIWWPN